MKKRRFLKINDLYSRFGISSLRAKILIPISLIIAVNLILSIFSFDYYTQASQERLLQQQLDNDASLLQDGFQIRLADISSAATILANDPLVIQNTELQEDHSLSILTNRALNARERYNLDIVQIYSDSNIIRVNVSDDEHQGFTQRDNIDYNETMHIRYLNGQPLVTASKVISEGTGAVVVGIFMDREIDRLLQNLRLISDVTISIDGIITGNAPGLYCNMNTGLIGGQFIQQYEYTLADRNVCLLLSRPSVYIQQVQNMGLRIMVINAAITMVTLAGMLFYLTKAITIPISNLSKASQAVAQGDLTRHITAHEINSKFGIGIDDELSMQAQAFNRMVADLNSLYTNLEDRVYNRTRELSATTEVAKAVAESQLNQRTISRAAAYAIQRRFDFDVVGVLKYNQERNQVCLIAGAQKLHFDEIPDGSCILVHENTLLSKVIDKQQAYISQMMKLEVNRYLLPNLPQDGSYAAIPIRTADTLHGVLYAQHQQTSFMSSDVTNLLHTLADQIAIGFENVDLYTMAQQARDAAQAANQAKGQFLAHMSHELRTPMNAILGFAQVLLRSDTISTKDKEHLEIVYRSGEHLLALINDVLDMSKIEAGRSTLVVTNFDLYDQLAELELMFRMRAEDAGLKLKLETDPNTPRYIRSDQGKLRQVLINLLGNAVKFTRNGIVTVKIKPVTTQEVITSPMGMFTQQRLRFEVSDTGPGIASEDQERIFQAFVQSGNQMHQGTGLGLPISREFVRMMGGELYVASAEGIGSTFSFEIELQVVNSAAVVHKESQRIVGVRSDKPLKILVVDDNSANRHLITEVMRNIGIANREVEGGQQAVEIVQTWMPDLIWMDMRMPNLDREQAARQIHEYCNENNIEAPVIIATTASIVDGEDQSLLWCNDLIWKPFHDYKLYNTMQEHLDIEFILEEKPEVPEAQDTTTDIFESAQQIDVVVRSKLESAITRLDMQEIDLLIESITEEHSSLGHHMQNLATSFDYDTILQLIRHTNPERPSAPEG